MVEPTFHCRGHKVSFEFEPPGSQPRIPHATRYAPQKKIRKEGCGNGMLIFLPFNPENALRDSFPLQFLCVYIYGEYKDSGAKVRNLDIR